MSLKNTLRLTGYYSYLIYYTQWCQMIQRKDLNIDIVDSENELKTAEQGARKKEKELKNANKKWRIEAERNTLVQILTQEKHSLYKHGIYWYVRSNTKRPQDFVMPTKIWQMPKGTLQKLPDNIKFAFFFSSNALTDRHALSLVNKAMYRLGYRNKKYDSPEISTEPLDTFLTTVRAELNEKYFYQGQDWECGSLTAITGGIISVPLLAYCSYIIGPLSQAWIAQSHVLSNIITGCRIPRVSCATLYVDALFGQCQGLKGYYANNTDGCARGIVSICKDACDSLDQDSIAWGLSLGGILISGLAFIAFVSWLAKKGYGDCQRDAADRFSEFNSLSDETKNASARMLSNSKIVDLLPNMHTPTRDRIKAVIQLRLKLPPTSSSLQRYTQFASEQKRPLLNPVQSGYESDEELDEKPDNRPWYRKLCCRKS